MSGGVVDGVTTPSNPVAPASFPVWGVGEGSGGCGAFNAVAGVTCQWVESPSVLVFFFVGKTII